MFCWIVFYFLILNLLIYLGTSLYKMFVNIDPDMDKYEKRIGTMKAFRLHKKIFEFDDKTFEFWNLLFVWILLLPFLFVFYSCIRFYQFIRDWVYSLLNKPKD